MPRTADGRLPPPILHGNTSGEFDEMCNANEQNQQYFIDRYAEEGIHLDYWWMDAGWYPCHGRWPQTGTWEPDPTRFPNGLRAISDHARAQGVKTLVWFEPERVAPGTWLYENHPDWLLARPDSPDLSTWERTFRLLDLGNRAAWQWLVDHVDGVLREQGIDLYRQDFNIDPLAFWRSHDAPDRLGMTENLYLQGYLAYWDELRRRHPDLIIDSCASGGRRNDLETMRRAVPLHPTDYNYAHWAVKQAFHRALMQWIPFFGSNVVPTDPVDAYVFRSGHGTSLVVGFDMRRSDLDYALMRNLCEEWRRVVPYYYGDFYPLTPYTVAEEDWMAWQLHRPTEDDGLVQAFRRGQNETPVHMFRLRGLDPSAQYVVENLDGGTSLTMTGAALMKQGLPVEIGSRPGAAMILYRRTVSRAQDSAGASGIDTRFTKPMTYSSRFEEALAYAARLHAQQVRKGTDIPYVSHILGVASIAIEHGADEDEAIAALLHDAVEDQGGAATAAEIRRRFGDRVAEIVKGCTDAEILPKPPWRQRKEAYLAHLPAATASIRLVSAADKLHNARAILRDYRELGEALWARFNGGRAGTLWYYRALVIAFEAAPEDKRSAPLVRELARTVDELERLAGSPAAAR